MAKPRTKKSTRTSAKKAPGIPDHVTFKYVFDDSYNPEYANGAYGGTTPQGELALNFFVERAPIPLEQTHAINSDGKVGALISSTPVIPDGGVSIVRFITTGVIFNLEAAKRIREFLDRSIGALESATASKQAVAAIQKAKAK